MDSPGISLSRNVLDILAPWTLALAGIWGLGISAAIARQAANETEIPSPDSAAQPGKNPMPSSDDPSSATRLATFGNGCFWCTEAVFQQLKGVVRAQSGYSGGHLKNPSYKQVCEGDTGHAEALQIEYDPRVISYEQLLRVFFLSHDPTTLNRQGADVGTQYRSVIFTHDEAQQAAAEKIKAEFTAARTFSSPIVTEITPYTEFYPAESYHADYFRLHGHEPYCNTVIAPKVEKVRKQFKELLKDE